MASDVNSAFVKKVLLIIGIVCAYRLGAYISLPFIDLKMLSDFALSMQDSGLLSTLKTFSGGALTRGSLFGLGLMPAISSSIIVQLTISAFPSLKTLKHEGGPEGQRKINLSSKLLTFAIGIVQGFVVAETFVSSGLYSGEMSVFGFKVLAAVLMSIGTTILSWMADVITSGGIGNGQSIIIFASIASDIPGDTIAVFDLARGGIINAGGLILLFAVFAITVATVVFVERSYRLIFVQYPRQAQNFMDRRGSVPQENYIPLKVNTAGIIPPIFASAVVGLIATIAKSESISRTFVGKLINVNLVRGGLMFLIFYSLLIVLFTFFYNTVVFDADDIADNLKRGNVFIPGCRPGTATATLIKKIVNKLSFLGVAYLLAVCVLPEILSQTYGRVFFVGGTQVLIAVSVVIDTMSSVRASLMSGKYQKVMKRYDRR